MKNKGLIILGAIVLVLFIVYMMVKGSYNTMVTQDEGVKSAWADVEVAYERRSALIPNLVSTVKGYANFEQETLTQVIEARSKATSVNIDANNLSPEAMQNFQNAQDGLSSALSRLLVTVERYPDLKANQNFMALQQELTNTENKIGFERQKFNKKVQLYNGNIRKFPNVIFAGMFGFSEKGYFKASAGAEKATEVNFD